MSLKQVKKYEYKKSSFLIRKYMLLKTLKTKNSKKLESDTITFTEYHKIYYLKQHINQKLDDTKYNLKKYHRFNVKLLN